MNWNWMKIFVPLACLGLVVVGWLEGRWLGVAAVSGGLMMFFLLHFSRLMKILHRAGDRPVGYIDSAVMFNARLKPRKSLLQIMAVTRSIGELRTAEGVQPEIFRWSDPGGSHVDCEFMNGKLVKWVLWRPPQEEEAGAVESPAPKAPEA